MPTLRHTPRFAVVMIAMAATLAASSPAWGWGRLGHRAAARLAEERLTPKALAAVRDLLEPGETLADASTWADEIRRDRRETAPWHYVNVPITEDHYDPKYCPPEGCVISAIKDQHAILKDPSAPKEKRREALRYLVHFVEDMHQPVHVGHRDDKGGNDLQVQFFDRGSNLHRVWDSGVIEHHDKDESAWVKEIEALATPENAALWDKGEVEDWADESLLYARAAYLDGNLKSGAKLDQAYEDLALPIARKRLAQAGVRIAAMLNATFP